MEQGRVVARHLRIRTVDGNRRLRQRRGRRSQQSFSLAGDARRVIPVKNPHDALRREIKRRQWLAHEAFLQRSKSKSQHACQVASRAASSITSTRSPTASRIRSDEASTTASRHRPKSFTKSARNRHEIGTKSARNRHENGTKSAQNRLKIGTTPVLVAPRDTRSGCPPQPVERSPAGCRRARSRTLICSSRSAIAPGCQTRQTRPESLWLPAQRRRASARSPTRCDSDAEHRRYEGS
eukprot:scaffold7356_cov249-Pinguiococcus_pyrenoidosus.AAC.8